MRKVILSPRVLYTIVIVFLVLLSSCAREPVEKKVTVVFRYDDYSSVSPTDLELKIIDTFRKSNLSITFGVIPFISADNVLDPSPQNTTPLTSLKEDILKSGFKEGLLDIALHGYSHQTIEAKRETEFSGLDYSIQLEKLAKGKKYLENIIDGPVTTFVPPWNTYDINTLWALEQLGFTTLSASNAGPATEASNLNFLPYTSNLSQLRDAIKSARMSSDDQPIIVILFHSYDFMEIDDKHGYITYQDFSDLLKWLKREGDIRLLSISQSIKAINGLSANSFLLNKWYTSLSKLLPTSLRERELRLYRVSTSLTEILLKIAGIYLLIVSACTILVFIVGILVLPKSTSIIKISVYGSLALSVFLLLYTLRDLSIHFKGMVACMGAIGCYIGLCFFSIYSRKFP